MIPLHILERINELKRVPRSGWLLAGIRTPESVADHSSATALLGICLAHAVNEDLSAAQLDQPLDVGKIAQMALLHDFAESVLTDLPLRATTILTKPVKHAAEARVMQESLAAVAGAESMLALWAEYRDVTSPEARLVHDADKLELVYQALAYEQQGQRNLDDYWDDLHWHYSLCAELFHQILSLRLHKTTVVR